MEDHGLVAVGLRALLSAEPIDIALEPTVTGLLRRSENFDLAILDLRLSDGSSVTSNVTRLTSAGFPVLVLTAADNLGLLREAAKTPVLGIVRKSAADAEIRGAILDALANRSSASVEWASAIDSDPQLPDAGLTSREREILALYASGETANGVAALTHLSPGVVANYVSRIRAKYANAGRPAKSRVQLYHRAVEDNLIEARES